MERPRQLLEGVGDSVTKGFDIDRPGILDVEVPRSILVLVTLAVVFTVLAGYGDTVVAGTAGRLIALAGLFGIVVVFPTLVSRCVRRGSSTTFFDPDREVDRRRLRRRFGR